VKFLIFLVLALAFFVFVVVPLGLALIAGVSLLFPLFVIGAGIWLIAGSKRRARRRRLSRWNWSAHAVPSARDWQVQPFVSRSSIATEPIQPAPAELPVDVQVKVEQIRRKAEVLLGYASRFAPYSQDLFLVRQTANDYLPRTIDAYLALPNGSAEKIVPDLGLTAVEELRQQLDLLDKKLDDIANDLERQDYDQLLANRRFLEARFGQPSD
jgi:hypothetical protein